MSETETLKKLYVALKKAQDRIAQLEAAQREPIAVISMSCRFPGGANSPKQYWDLLKSGVDAISEVPAERWDANVYYDPNPTALGKMYTAQGGFIDQPMDEFDTGFFNISPREANSLDPQQRLLLETSWEALENAGIEIAKLVKSRTGVFIGISGNDYALAHRHSGDYNKINAYSMRGTTFSMAAGRLSYTYGLEGPNMAVDTACSSSLVAFHLACQSLRSRESDLALAGGVNLILTPDTHVCFSKLQALSPDGRCRAFDTSANGYGRGEGCGMVVLKRLTEALEAGDPVLAVVKGTAVNQDGKSSGLTVPNGRAQQELICQALDNAGLSFRDIDYIETHSTGTSLGDSIEIEAIARILKQDYPEDKVLLIGTAKTNIGHLEPAAGMAGLIKVILSLIHEQIPPNLHFNQPNPHIPWGDLAIKVPIQLTPWPHSDRSRAAGVSAFGFSGTNAHVIIAQAPVRSRPASERDRPVHILALSAKQEKALAELAARYVDYLAREEIVEELADICYTATTGRCHFGHRVAVVGRSKQDLRRKLSEYLSDPTGGVYRPQVRVNTDKIAFLFTGQGAQYVGMGWQLYETQRSFRDTLDTCAEILRDHLEIPLLEVLYPTIWRSARQQPPDSPLHETAYAQPALFALEYALAELWRSWGLEPTVVMGHSVGEYVAACVAGVFGVEDGLKLIAKRGRLLQTLPISHAFHSPLIEPMLADFEVAARRVRYAPPMIGVVSNVTGELIAEELASPAYWCRHLRQPVRFAAGMEALYRQGHEIFLELGPKPVLLTMGRQCLPTGTGLWCPSLHEGQEDWQSLLQSISILYMHGISINWTNLDRDPGRRKLMLPNYPFQRQRYWMEPAGEPLTRLPDSGELPDWCYEIHWRPIPSLIFPLGTEGKITGSGTPPGAWLILADAAGSGETLAAALAAQGLRVLRALPGTGFARLDDNTWCVAPDSPQDFVALLQAAPAVAGILHLWSLNRLATETAMDLEKAQERACGGALHAVQALLKTQPAPVWLITQGAVRVYEETPDPIQAPLWGLGKGIALEHPDCWGGLVDLDPRCPVDVQCEWLVRLILAGGHEDQIALRAEQAYAPRLCPASPPAPATPPLRSDAAYLITGGLGSIGLAIARWLAQRGARHLLLCGRREPDTAARKTLAELERLGIQIQVIRADVADAATLQAAVAGSARPVRGVVHAAGVLGHRPLAELDLATLQATLRPKMLGGWVLQHLDLELDFFLCLSSIASVWGSRHQAHYAAANAFLDTLAHYRKSRGEPALTINWGPWAEDGMASTEARAMLARLGVAALNSAPALELMGALLASSQTQTVMADMDWARFREIYEIRGPRPLLSELPAAPAMATSARPAGLADRLAALSPEDRWEALLAHLQTEVAGVLGFAGPQEINQTQGFFEMGMDSIMAVDLKNRLEERLGRPLPATLAFDCPDLSRLTAYLAREVLGWEEATGPGARPPAEPVPEEVHAQLAAAGLEAAIAERLVRLEALMGSR